MATSIHLILSWELNLADEPHTYSPELLWVRFWQVGSIVSHLTSQWYQVSHFTKTISWLSILTKHCVQGIAHGFEDAVTQLISDPGKAPFRPDTSLSDPHLASYMNSLFLMWCVNWANGRKNFKLEIRGAPWTFHMSYMMSGLGQMDMAWSNNLVRQTGMSWGPNYVCGLQLLHCCFKWTDEAEGDL